jgi:hypothetical protein
MQPCVHDEGNSKMKDLTMGLEHGVAYCNAEWDCPQVIVSDGNATFFEGDRPDETIVCTVNQFNRMGAAVLADRPVPSDWQMTVDGDNVTLAKAGQQVITDFAEFRDFLAKAAEHGLNRAPVAA